MRSATTAITTAVDAPEFGADEVPASADPVASAVAEQLGLESSEFNLPETKIILLLRPEHDTTEQVDRHVSAVKCALEFYGLRFGPCFALKN